MFADNCYSLFFKAGRLCKLLFLILGLWFVQSSLLLAAYRAYYYQVYDQLTQVTWTVVTGFDPPSYISTIGKKGFINLEVKASWLCSGITSYQKPCSMPPPLGAKYKLGQKLRVITAAEQPDWQGTVEVVLWQDTLGTNVYGLRLDDSLDYAVFSEFNLLPVEELN